ncbi:MAG: TolC family protein [Planctomycetaceae bacterium]
MIASGVLLLAGCSTPAAWQETVGNDTSAIDRVAARVDQPATEIHTAAMSQAPLTARDQIRLDEISYVDVSLDEVLRVAMTNSDVLRELGGTVLRHPEIMYSRFSNSLQVTDPRFSPEAALSAFDAQLKASAFFSNNDQIFNNPFFAGGITNFRQDLNEYNIELSKRTATGSRFALRSISKYDSNNAPGNTFPSAWDTYLEGELRQPLLQGGGLQFNRIAGPGSSPGVYNGILLARVSADRTQAEFEVAVRDYVSNVVNAYWDLYYSYRDLDARSRAMQRSLEVWNRVRSRQQSDLDSGAREYLAREQYYRFRTEVDEALSGRLVQGTQNRNGSTGGTVRGASGVQVAERRLRLLTGMAITDGQLLRPSDEPLLADVVFDWDAVMHEALNRRPEIRRQQLQVRRREMELLAARNFLNPQLDAVGRYRFRGFGHDLVNYDGLQSSTAPSSAAGSLTTGDLQEWYLGVEYTVPLGFRKAHLAVTNSELMLSRERIILREQQREVVHDLSNAITDASRAYEACRNCMNRYLAAHELLQAYEARDQNDIEIDVDRLLDAQRRVAEAEIRYFQSRTEYAVALKNVHLEKGSLMAYSDLEILDGEVPVVTEPVTGTEQSDAGQADTEPPARSTTAPDEAREPEPTELDDSVE